MGKLFHLPPQEGKPIAFRGLARGLRRADYALTNLSVENGHVEWSKLGAPKIVFGDDGAGSSPAFLQLIKQNGYPFGKRFNFGISINGTNVNILRGVAKRGACIYAFGSDNLTIMADNDWIALRVKPSDTPNYDEFTYWRYPDNGGLGPTDHDGYWVYPLHQFIIDDDGNAQLVFSTMFDGIITGMAH